jgi:hypothetical protein
MIKARQGKQTDMGQMRLITSSRGPGANMSFGQNLLLQNQFEASRRNTLRAALDIPALAGGSGNPDMHGFRTAVLKDYHLVQQGSGSGGPVCGMVAMSIPGQSAIMGVDGYFKEGTPLLLQPTSTNRPSGQTLIDPAQEPTGYRGSKNTGIIEKRFPFNFNGNTFYKSFLFEEPQGYLTAPNERYYGNRGPVDFQARSEPVGHNSIKDPATGMALQNPPISGGNGWSGTSSTPDPSLKPQITGVWELKLAFWVPPGSTRSLVKTVEEIRRDTNNKMTFSQSEESSLYETDNNNKQLVFRGKNFLGRGSVYIGRNFALPTNPLTGADSDYNYYISRYGQTTVGIGAANQSPPYPELDNEDTLMVADITPSFFEPGLYDFSLVGANGMVCTMHNFLEITA